MGVYGGGGVGGGLVGGGFREVLVDQPFTGKWLEVDMNLGGSGGHSTFQGTKFSDFAGGFSYRAQPPKSPNSSHSSSVTHQRSIYWRTLNDNLELTELSLSHPLLDNQVRYIFQGSPIVGPITIQETDAHLIILVATVTSLNRFIFTHPRRLHPSSSHSIFHQICNKPQMSFRSFNLYEHAINIPVPLGATCAYIERGPLFQESRSGGIQQQSGGGGGGGCSGDSVFAFSFESGSINVYRIGRDDVLQLYDLRQANLFTRLFSGLTTSILQRTPTTSADAVIGLSFFTTKRAGGGGGGGGGVLLLVTLTMKGQLILWSLPSGLDSWTEWASYHCGVVDGRFAVDNYTDSCMLLRKSEDQGAGEYPTFGIYIPGDGFRIYKVQKVKGGGLPGLSGGGQHQQQHLPRAGASQFSLVYHRQVEFKNREVMDFCVTGHHLFTLVNNPEEETEWEMGAYPFGDGGEGGGGNRASSSFLPALLEPLPLPDVEPSPGYVEAKEFYMALIFNSSSFTASTITKALTMFRKTEDQVIQDRDWDSLRITAMNVIDREIALETSDSEFEISDEDYTGLSLKFWSMFYNSCVEYHIHTVKPLGLFYETNSGMVCVVKKSRISFLRPTDLLETLYYFPQSLNLPSSTCGGGGVVGLDPMEEDEDDEERRALGGVAKYLEIIQTLEDIFNESHLAKITKRLRENVGGVQGVCKEIAQFLLSTDPHCFVAEERQLVQILEGQLAQLGGGREAEEAMKRTLDLISTWEEGEDEGALLLGGGGDEEESEDCSLLAAGGGGGNFYSSASPSFMGSRLGAHITHRILRQLMEHRFLIARDTMILQYMWTSFFAQTSGGGGGGDGDGEGGSGSGGGVSVSWDDHDDARRSTIAYYALLEIGENLLEPIPSFMRERGLKVANILKTPFSTGGGGGGGEKLGGWEDAGGDGFWPTKVIEGFCLSSIGTRAISSCGGGGGGGSAPCPPLTVAQAVGRSIWTNGGIGERSRPLEDFLLVGCQYNILLKYANFMVDYFINQLPMKHFFTGLCHLCLFKEDVGLAHFRAISFEQAQTDEHFCSRVLQHPSQSPFEPNFTNFYVRVISILQVLEYLPGVLRMASEGLGVAEREEDAIKMCALAFKSSLQLGDYTAAYSYILRMPGRTGERGLQEKFASLRTFVSHLVKEGALETLLSLNMDALFNASTSVREQVEGILFAQANLADPLSQDGVYQMLYVFHLAKDNYHKAAAVMYYRAMRLGDKGMGGDALEAQKVAYLDVLTCLALIEPESCRTVIKRTGLVRESPLPPIYSWDPENPLEEGEDEEDWDFEVPALPRDKELVVMGLKEIEKEFQVLIMLSKLEEDKPVKPTDFERRARKAVDDLALSHRYDDALFLASLWGLDPTPVVSYVTDICCNLVYNILPEGGDPAQYFIHNDTSELPSSESGYTEMGFRLLERYLQRVEKPVESTLHQLITLKLLGAEVELPQWLLISYKKRNVRQLLNCLLRYGEWEKGTELVLKVLDAALGRARADEFDGTVGKLSAYDPLEPATLPFNDINRLATELVERAEENPKYLEMYKALKERSSLFCDRVIECTNERNLMFVPDRK